MSNPLISIVTGTFNRLQYLQQMITSARACIPRGIDAEFVVVDGGSTDGTQEWCKSQSDIVLIEQGELLGAIKAFDAGAYAAHGEYVLLANDDIYFHPGSIMPAVAYLESHSTCGAIAFMDDRPAPGYETGYKVQTIQVQDTDGDYISLPYAQVGLFRKWLGDKAGWWGSRDSIMGWGGTYGGDNFLSARIYELGYTIDVVDACKITDLIPPDGLREHNYEQEKRNPGAYYKRYPQPPKRAVHPTVINPQQERLRFLYLPIYEPFDVVQRKHKKGLREALGRRGLVYELDYVNDQYDLTRIVKDWQPHIMIMQAHTASIPLAQLRPAREAKPDMLVINWNGDVYEKFLTEPFILSYLRHVDLQLTVNANVLDTYHRENIPAAYWQVGYEPVEMDKLPLVPQHDVVFLANAYSDQRKALGHLLQSMQGLNIGLYGRGWEFGNGDCTYNFPISTALYKRAIVSIGDNQFPEQRGFVSNRIFEALASGAFLLHQRVAGLDELTGIKAGVHYVEWTNQQELQDLIRLWVQPRMANERTQISQAGQAFVREFHSFDHRVDELFSILEHISEPV